MDKESVTFEKLRNSFYKKLSSEPYNGELNGTLIHLSEEFSEGQNQTARADDEFAMAWILDALVSELLNYSIEDDYIDSDDLHPKATKELLNLLESKNWINNLVNQSVVNFLGVCRKAAMKKTLAALRVELRIPTNKGYCRIKGLIPKVGQPDIPVSSKRFPFVPVLEDSLSDPAYAQGLVDAFAERLIRLKREEKITFLCFVEKAIGPIGAFGMLSALVDKLKDLPACIYRQSYWADRAKFVGCQPKKTDRITIVYDLFVTGEGVRQIAKKLKEKFNAPVVSSVVLFGYDETKNPVEIEGQIINVEAIGWYHTFASQIEDIQKKGAKETKNIILLPNARRSLSSSALGISRGNERPPKKGGGTMESLLKWNRSFGSYSNDELRAVKFKSVKEIDRAIDLTWEDTDLKGLAWHSPDGITLFVPEEAVELFKIKGLKFQVSKVISPDDIPPKSLAEMREKYGM